MLKGRFLHEEKLKDHFNLGVYGIFNTTKVHWKYYVISYELAPNNSIRLTGELCSYGQLASYESIEKNGKEFATKELAKEFIQQYKIKWETGSNNTQQEVRAEKLNNILDE
jgi:hypothetical protein